jgi:hypothetical protein
VRCSGCGAPFIDADRVDLSSRLITNPLARGMAESLVKLAKVDLHRIRAFQCPEPGCGGLYSIVYLPPAPPAAPAVQALPIAPPAE